MTNASRPAAFARITSEYHSQLQLYTQFCESVRNVVVALIERHALKSQVSWRIKSLDSIREKIRRNEPKGLRYARLADIEDLAGIRVVFYVESDKRRFLSLLPREMTRGRVKVEEHRKDRGYRSTHVLVQFGAKRLALNEYARFKGLKCEVQLTSALYHAWAEIEHDILYKRNPTLAPLSRAALARLEHQFDVLMVDHIRPAAAILDAIAVSASGPARPTARTRR
jgi:ppGpp synthetase/RelA/SpoT-type nucleotidyltranferase